MVKYSRSPREIPWAPPSGFPSCSGYISLYTPPLVIIQIQYYFTDIDWPKLAKATFREHNFFLSEKRIPEPLHGLLTFLVIVTEGDDGVDKAKDSHQKGQDELF